MMLTHWKGTIARYGYYTKMVCPECGESALSWEVGIQRLWMCYSCGESGVVKGDHEKAKDKNSRTDR